MGLRTNLNRKFEICENENTTYQNLWDAAQAELRGKFKALNTYIRKDKRSKISHLSFQTRKIEEKKKEMTAEINEIENRKSIGTIMNPMLVL